MVLRRKKSLKRQVTWVPGEKPVVKNYPPPPGYSEVVLSDAEVKMRAAHMRVGTLWITTTSLGIRADVPGYEPYLTPYLDSTSHRSTFPRGTPAVYMGTLRVEETVPGWGVRASRNSRHCFLVYGIRYLTNNLLDFIPLQ